MKTETEDIFTDDDLINDNDQNEVKKSLWRRPARYKSRSKRSSICRFT